MDNNSEQLNFDGNRRDFLKKAGIAVGSIFLALPVITALESCGSGRSLKAGNLASHITVDVSLLASDGAAMTTTEVGPDGAPILVHRISPTQYEAHSLVCTHKGCVVDDANQNGIATCPCHGAQFNSGGKVLAGPAKENLKAYPTSFNSQGNILTIKFTRQS